MYINVLVNYTDVQLFKYISYKAYVDIRNAQTCREFLSLFEPN